MTIKQKLDAMLRKKVQLHGYTYDEKGVMVGADKAVTEFMTALGSIEPDPKEQAKMIVEAWDDKTGELQNALGSMRIEQVSNFMVTESHFGAMFFETVTLQPDEEPYIVNDTLNEVKAAHIGEDGTPDQIRVVRPQSKTAIGLHILMSDKVRYKTLDLYRGDVRAISEKTFDISRDLSFKFDRQLFNLLNQTPANGGCFGAFSFEQARARKEQRIYLAHSGIVTAHLPTTNDILNGDEGTTRFTTRYYDKNPPDGLNGFRPAVLLAVVDYCDSWANVLPGVPKLNPTGEIIVPSSDIIEIARALIPSPNNVENRIQEDVNRDGYTSIHYMGRDWKFIPDVTIAKGTCYPRLTYLPGRVYRKPSYDKDVEKEDLEENWKFRYSRLAYGAYVISQYRPRAIRVSYVTE